MAIQNYSTVTARIGKLKGEILAHAMPVEVLGITGMQKQMPKNQSDTVVFRRYLPYGGTDNKWITGSNVATFAGDHITQEGVTPSADTLSATDITVQLHPGIVKGPIHLECDGAFFMESHLKIILFPEG